MGQGSSVAVELIHVQRHGSPAFRCAVAEMQGWRGNHEDAHDMRCNDKAGSFWVLDGHGGDGAALYSAPSLGAEFSESLSKGKLPTNAEIDQGFTDVDVELRAYCKRNPGDQSGCTVVGALATKEADGTYNMKLVNAGDSRALVVRGPKEKAPSNKVPLKVPKHLSDLKSDPAAVQAGYAARDCGWPLVQETVDHKPSHPTEKARIEAAGGYVSGDEPPRVDGQIAVSRGLGDFEFKTDTVAPPGKQKLTCIPDIYELSGLQPGTIVVLCCDGVWDVMTGQEVGELVRNRLAGDQKADLGEIAADIIRISLGKNSQDNITAMVVECADGAGWQGKHQPPDEMAGFEKLQGPSGDEPEMDEDGKKSYRNFLRRSHFPEDPVCCDECGRWYLGMMRCPKTEKVYCNRQCQKKGWAKYKATACLKAA